MHRSLLESLDPSKPPLRIGLLLDSRTLSRVFAEITRQIIDSEFAGLELLIFNNASLNGADNPAPNRSKLRVLFDNLTIPSLRKRFLFTIYERWDRRHSNPQIEPTADVDCTALLDGIESIEVTPITKKFVHRFPPEAIEKIRSKKLDVLIRFGFNILRGEILTCAEHGVWSYHHGDNDFYRGGQAYFWEVFERNPISGVILQILTEELDAGHVLEKGYFSTAPGLSQVQNRVAPFWGSSTFMIQKLRELHGRGWEWVEKRSLVRSAYRGRKKLYRAPTNWEMVRWIAPVLATKAVKRIRRKELVAFWRLACRTGAKHLEDSGAAADVRGFEWLECPRGHFYADPFILEHEGKLWLFLEDFVYSEKRGRIACAELKDGQLGTVIPVLDKPFHLSYPCVFRDGETVYMLPESEANSTVDLYRASNFPHAWEHVRTVYDGPAVDTTVWRRDGAWYFFSTLTEKRGQGAQLWLFCAGSPSSEWSPHPASPISTDVRSSRGGGAIFERNGRLFRPSQDCGAAYGRSFTLNEILILSPTEYKEEPCVTVEPVWAENLVGTHSYAQAAGVEVIDGCQFVEPREVYEK